MPTRLRFLFFGVLLVCSPAHADITISEGTNITVDVRDDGRMVMDLIGGLWLIPPTGGGAERLPNDLHPARSPRFSPEGDSVVYVAEQGQASELWIYDLVSRTTRPVAAEFGHYEQPDWHPDGSRVVFAADADGAGLAVWEVDVPTGLAWRLTHGDGDSFWPAWSADGRDLLYIRHLHERYELVLRRRNAADEVLLESAEPMSAPAFRPDKSLVTVLVHGAAGIRIDMVILSRPRLVRTLVDDDDIFVGRVAWLGRQRLFYTAGGHVRERVFDAWSSKNVEFSAKIEPPSMAPGGKVLGRRLAPVEPGARTLVIRAERMFDGLSREYRRNVDVVVANGRIQAIESTRQRPDADLVDLGDITVMPGLIDVLARLPRELDDSVGARLLSFGVTMVVAEHRDAEGADARWTTAATPGPRVLRATPLVADTARPPWLFLLHGDRNTGESFSAATRRWQEAGVPVLADNWQVGLGAGASLVLGGMALPVSPAGRRYADLRVTNGSSAVTIVSALAHAGTRDLGALFGLRQAAGLDRQGRQIRRFAATTTLAPGQSQVVLGSAPSGLPPGVAPHAELRAMVEAGLEPVDAIRAATVDAATALGLGLTAGRLAPGADANFVLVLGDPLADIRDAANVVGTVQNGRFMSLGRLLDRLPVD